MKTCVLIRNFIWTIAALFGCVGLAQAQIGVAEAQIGCTDLTQNRGNLTAIVGSACNGKFSCSFPAPTPAQYSAKHVQVYGRTFCTQAMEIEYWCATGPVQSVIVPGDAWTHPPAQLFCEPPSTPPGNTSTPQNPLVPVLQGLLQKYKGCILERYETQQDMINRGLDKNLSGLSNTNGLQNRDVVTCVAGNQCSLAFRLSTYTTLQAQASRGDSTNFDANLEKAIPADCFACQKHAEEHTKHVHCTMEAGGNNGLFQGPKFEACKAGVDISKLVSDVMNDIHSVLGGTGEPSNASGGPSVATKHQGRTPPRQRTPGETAFMAPKPFL